MSIPERQNEAGALRTARAFRRRYALAGRWRVLRVAVSLILGTAGVVLSAAVHETTDYVAAAAGLWILLSRTILSSQEQAEQDRGALAQEMFDTRVFDLPWSTLVCGSPPGPEDIRCWGERQSGDGLRDWYPDVAAVQRPVDVVICQRSSVTWARQDHATYARVLRVAVAAGFAATIIGGVAFDLTLGEYLLHLGLPVLPAAIDVLEMAGASSELSQRRGLIELRTNDLLEQASSHAALPTVGDVRLVQDAVFAARRLGRVPQWFYKLTRERRERNMRDAAQELIDGLPAALRGGPS